MTRAMLMLAIVSRISCDHAECPDRWYVNGVRPNGRYQCLPVLGDPERDIEDARARVEIHDARSIEGAIYCTGGARPIVVDSRTIGCQRGGWP